MLAKLRGNPSQRKPLVTPEKKQGVTATANETSKPSSPDSRQSKLRKKKVGDSSGKRVSLPVFVTELNPTLSPVSPVVSDPSVPFGVYESEFRLEAETRAEDEPPAPVGVTPDRTTLPVFDLRRDDFTANYTIPSEPYKSSAQPNGAVPREDSSVKTHSKPNIRRSYSDVPCSRTRKLVKKPPPLSEDPNMSPLSALKRRFSYAPSSPHEKLETEITEDDIKRLSITATRRPEFTSDESAEQSPAVHVIIVDQLPHQQLSPRIRMSRRISGVPTIPERDVNEEFLEEQEEVLSYLHNTLLIPPSEESPTKSVFSDGGLPQTPPSTLPRRQPSFTPSSASFVGLMKSEFPYLLGEQSENFDTSPLHPKLSPLYELGLAPTSANVSRFNNTNFPPSPPQSVGRGSTDDTRSILNELASESISMKSVVDAINNACTPRTSFDYTDDGSVYDFDDSQSSILPSDEQLPFSSQGDDSYRNSFDQDDNDSIYSFAAPILRNGRAHKPSLLSLSSSQSANSESSDNPITKPPKHNLPPLITSNYGPSLKRRAHVRGKRSISTPISTTVQPKLVKVVEEEIVEYTPIEDQGGWMRQRRISRDGNWIVVEREILEKGVI